MYETADFIDNVPNLPPHREKTGTQVDRRTFLKSTALASLAAVCSGGMLPDGIAYASPVPGEDERFVAEAWFYEKLPYKKIRCKLCPKQCVIDDRERGYCGTRENRDGTYYTLVHSRPCTYHADPIEKKPLFHFLPGTLAFSISTAGCNVNCKFCQNWQISQVRPEQVRSIHMPPKVVVSLTKKARCTSIAYTYGEPVVFYEYMAETAAVGREMGLKSVVITGGYINEEPVRKLCRHVDAIKVDLKAFSEKYYREVVSGELQPVLDGLVTIRKEGMWTEIVYLVVPTLNDSDGEFTKLCRWIKSDLGVDVPVHFTRFHPDYLLRNLPRTPIQTLERAKAIADSEGLHYVYLGNVPGHSAENTFCPRCKRVVVQRTGFISKAVHIVDGKCRYCEQEIAGVWN